MYVPFSRVLKYGKLWLNYRMSHQKTLFYDALQVENPGDVSE
jgi:hypothetical protein